MASPHPDDVERFNSAYRQVIRRRARGAIGATVSGFLTPALPYMAIPAGVGIYAVDKADDAREALRALEAQGFKPRKRDLIRGTLRATAEKAILTPLTLGHDEILLAGYGGVVDYNVDDIARDHWIVAEGIEGTSDINHGVNAPINGAQELFHVEGGNERLAEIQATGVDSGGWHEAPATVAANVVGVGAVAGAVEYAVDRPFGYRDDQAKEQGELEESVAAKTEEERVSEDGIRVRPMERIPEQEDGIRVKAVDVTSEQDDGIRVKPM